MAKHTELGHQAEARVIARWLGGEGLSFMPGKRGAAPSRSNGASSSLIPKQPNPAEIDGVCQLPEERALPGAPCFLSG